ncbi:MAG: class I SAM-dependent methyltransferase [Pseudomonadales bacterium]|nr:class I SAM-dependent methyltransferase [Pseudomonadales bacterium]MBO6594911.1 class I SAM-dependent methyltransferase [Pseudomonadales bacterium]MBO6821529.1 class I SAM-dependent methyltransferase [Pseudomonadales bacterium]
MSELQDVAKKKGWDERYSNDEYIFGKEPNDFLKSVAAQIPEGGKVLCLADGEGRNGVYLAGLGYQVTSVDQSPVGLNKANALAEERGVSIETVAADLTEWDLGTDCWHAVVSIFFHIPEAPRNQIYERVTNALKPDGLLILESYTPNQLKFRTGGPPTSELMMTKDIARSTFPALDFEFCEELERDVIEGTDHTGRAAIIQVIARRPAN